MAWATPPAFVVSEIVTAARLNILSDDLAYLKGTAGAIQLDAALTVRNAVRPTITLDDTATAKGRVTSVISGGWIGLLGNLSFDGSNWNLDDTAAPGWYMKVDPRVGTDAWEIARASAGANPRTTISQMLLSGAGNLGIGTQTPQGRVHAVGAGGGWIFLSANAVTSLQTLAAAGTVTVGMIVWLCDRNNTAGAFATGFNGQVFSLTSALTYVNTDTMTLTLTAGGAITIQRTTGTNGSHQVNMAIMYF